MLLKTLICKDHCDTQVIEDTLQVSDLEGSTFIDLPDVYLQESMPVTVKDAPKQEDLDRWKHLRDIRLPELNRSRHHIIPEVTIMLGSNVPATSQPLEVKSGDIGEPYAIRSILGWMVYGIISADVERAISVHFSRVTSVQRSSDNLEQLFQSFVSRDFDERHGEEKGISIEDKKFLKMMNHSIVRDKDGHFQMALPFRNEDVQMPNNQQRAKLYALGLKRRLQRDQDLHQQYSDFMEDIKVKSYAEKVPEDELVRDDGRVWYIPHHGVFQPQKLKIRVVFNCAATYQGTSLNSELLQGPDLTNRLSGVLLRWREEPVAAMADIQSMFYQVRIDKKDRDMLRYLWWPGGDLTRSLEEYRMLVHPFGAVSSPSCANFALRKIAEDVIDERPKVADAIRSDFYVDDMLKSFPSEPEAIEVSLDIKETLKKGGFRLTKWVSNSRRLLEVMPQEDRSNETKSLDLDQDALPVERALGIKWDAETDQLGFTYKNLHKTPTRRNILSVVGSIYDPLGMVAPYALKAKMILQKLCMKKIGWDDALPEQERGEWDSWTRELPNIETVRLTRCFKPVWDHPPKEVQLHHFADASESGYGTVSYLRYCNGSQVHCSFVLAKARVAPLKMVSIPRLELTAATLMVRVNHMLQKELKMHLDQVYFWTDSQTVLKYINNETSRFKTFVANRVEVIRNGSETSQWNYVPTECNPADDCSRGLSMEKLLKCERWFNGPQFLWKATSEWPGRSFALDETLSNQDPEVRVKVGVVKSIAEPDAVTTLTHHYSEWMRLKRAVAWWLRLKHILQQRAQKDTEPAGPKKESPQVETQQNEPKSGIKKDSPRCAEIVQEIEDKIQRQPSSMNATKEQPNLDLQKPVKKSKPEQPEIDNEANESHIEILTDAKALSNGNNSELTTTPTKYLSAKELRRAEEAVIKVVQQQVFHDEISVLQKQLELVEGKKSDETVAASKRDGAPGKKISSNSSILDLDPMLRNGLLCVGGRLHKAPIPEDSKHQLILPANHHVSDLIISHVHRQCNHQGRNYVLSQLRQRYWILRAGVKVKGLVRRCVVCRKQRSKQGTQMMADLPANRIKPDEPPFSYVGVDYFGPFEVKQGRSVRKRYGVIFTCMTSRAVHLEIADSMDTSSFINDKCT